MMDLATLIQDSAPQSDPSSVNSDFNGILEPEEFSYEWRRASVPITMIDTEALYLDKDRFSAVQSVSTVRREPIILLAKLAEKLQLLDGGHRIQVALAEGRHEIDALIGIHPELEESKERSTPTRMHP
jgi:hypothetical protein